MRFKPLIPYSDDVSIYPNLTNDKYGAPEGQSDPRVQNGVSVHHAL